MSVDATTYRDELLGCVLLNRYEVFEVNQGGFGLVLGAFDQVTRQDVAIKTPRTENREISDSLDEFKAEVRFWLQLDPHPNIVTAKFVDQIFDCPALFMDYVRGCPFKTVRGWLLSGGLNRDAAIAIMHHVAIGMTFANHREEITHLDLKPENVLIDPVGICKVTDFGLAQRVRVVGNKYPHPNAATWVYAAPEIFANQVGDQRSDIFSYGLFSYEMLTGGLPFRGNSVGYEGLKAYHANRGISTVASDLYYNGLAGDGGQELGVILSSCLQHHQSERLRSFADLVEMLERGLHLRRPAYLDEAVCSEDLLQRAVGLRQVGSYSVALAILNRLLTQQPGRGEVWAEAALTLRSLGDEAAAAQFDIRARALGA